MRDTSDRPSAPNYVSACIVMFGVNLTWMLVVIWAIWGLIAAGLVGWAINRLINRINAAKA